MEMPYPGKGAAGNIYMHHAMKEPEVTEPRKSRPYVVVLVEETMKALRSRGERKYVWMPDFMAKTYIKFSTGKRSKVRHGQVARHVSEGDVAGNILDAGFGSGDTLLQVRELNPDINLYGIDISSTMLKIAKDKLRGTNVSLTCGSIEKTDFADDFFDRVFSFGSFYIWDHPENCLKEIHRILKKGGCFYLFEIFKDHDREKAKEEYNVLKHEHSIPFRMISGLFYNRPYKNAYTRDEYSKIFEKAGLFTLTSVDEVEIGGLSMWLKMILTKNGE